MAVVVLPTPPFWFMTDTIFFMSFKGLHRILWGCLLGEIKVKTIFQRFHFCQTITLCQLFKENCFECNTDRQVFRLNREPALNAPDSQLKHTLCRASPPAGCKWLPDPAGRAWRPAAAARGVKRAGQYHFAREKSCKKKVPSTKNLWQILMWLLLRSQYRFERFGQGPICHQRCPSSDCVGRTVSGEVGHRKVYY